MSRASVDPRLAAQQVREARSSAGPLMVLLSLTLLILVDLARRLRGFSSIHRLVRSTPVLRERSEPDFARARRLCIAADRAASLYFKHPWCLQRSAATVILLRLLGLPAQLVIAVRRIPFQAHAWVEMHGVVLNDRPDIEKAYERIEEC